MTVAHIYALYDPDDPSHVRYIGKTDNVERRLSQHLQAALMRNLIRPSCEWIRMLALRGVSPGIRVLKTVPLEQWAVAERAEILAYRVDGHQLTNATEGGNGAWFPDPAARERHRAGVSVAMQSAAVQAKIRKPKSEAHKLALSDALSGRSLSDETKSRLAAARTGKALSIKHRMQISSAHLNRREVLVAKPVKQGMGRGVAHGMAKISEDDAREIKSSPETCSMLAARFGLSRGYVSAIKRGIKWAHL